MLGTETLKYLASEEIYDNIDDKFLHDITAIHAKVIKSIRKRDDWLLPFVGQYDDRYLPTLEDSYWYWLFGQMINNEEIYITIIPLKDWAFSDNQRKENYKNLTDSGIIVDNEIRHHEDACFEIQNPITLRQLYLNDEITPEFKDIPKLEFNNLCGVVEFGTTSFAKTCYYLKSGFNVLRVPYGYSFESDEMKDLKPFCIIFHNKKPLNEILPIF